MPQQSVNHVSVEDRFRDRVAVVTGAASGIGRALAVLLASRGARLALSDIDASGLEETVRRCAGDGAAVRPAIVDVTSESAVGNYADDVAAHFGRVDLVFNNAGVIFTGDIIESSYEDLHRVVDVDFWGVVHGTKAFLPYLIASGDGHLVNVSSAFGLMAAPSYSAYNAAKFAVRGFTEAVQQEMHAARYPVRVTCVYPGAVRTSIFRTSTFAASQDHLLINERFDRLVRTDPEQAAATILRGVSAGKKRILIGADARAVDLLTRLSGAGYQRVFQLISAHRRRPHESTAATKER